MRLNIPTALFIALVCNDPKTNHMTDLSFPPWEPGADEQSTVARAGFAVCEAAVEALASKAGSTVLDSELSVSKQWGNVLRAKVVIARAGLSATTQVTCWSEPKSGVQMVARVLDCGAQLSGC